VDATERSKFDLVKGRHWYSRYRDGIRSTTDDAVMRSVERYFERIGQPLAASRWPEQHPVQIVAVMPTIGVVDRSITLDSPRLRMGTKWSFGEDLWWFDPENADEPQHLTFANGIAVLAAPWGYLVFDSLQGKVTAVSERPK